MMTNELELASICLAYVLTGEPENNLRSKLAVASVVMTRAKTIDNVCRVVYEPHQFEYITKITQNEIPEPNKKELLKNQLIALDVLMGKYHLKNYTHFHDDRIKNPFKKPLKEKIGALSFY